ncbi:mycofactocin biosynthesis chaperone MftB [Rhodococcus sp. HNM0569]|uniref:mycofactocin biosynthesis chaperone MftB n=1 Tax=Rhodococcus sp. HNM0569 TaxID=2716340 RepID=UPI00146CF01F|nr:mycofactocin biosynthesis chaperone MftB [Rhodococcus sp. HNM0569]
MSTAAETGRRERVAFDSGQAWTVHPQVAIRPEPFGALLYHFGTRKLSFLKNRVVVEVVRALGDHPDARSALHAHGIEGENAAPYLHALSTLADSSMIVPADPREGAGGATQPRKEQ